MKNISALLTLIKNKLEAANINIEVSTEFSTRELYSKLPKPLVVIYLKDIALSKVSLGSINSSYYAPVYGSKADILVGFKLFFGYDEKTCTTLSSLVAQAILFDDELEAASFSCQKANYNLTHELIIQECEAKFSLVFEKEKESD